MAGRQARLAAHTTSVRAREDDYCFACGPNNPIGLRLNFRLAGNRVETTYIPTREHQGFVDIIHGGLVGLVLDEAMAKVLSLQGIEALTCEITVRLGRAMTVGEPLKVTAYAVSERKRLYLLQAAAEDSAGEMVATAQAKFLRVRGSDAAGQQRLT